MQRRDFETDQKRFRDFKILSKFFETHVFQGTIRHPSFGKLQKLWVVIWEKAIFLHYFACPAY